MATTRDRLTKGTPATISGTPEFFTDEERAVERQRLEDENLQKRKEFAERIKGRIAEGKLKASEADIRSEAEGLGITEDELEGFVRGERDAYQSRALAGQAPVQGGALRTVKQQAEDALMAQAGVDVLEAGGFAQRDAIRQGMRTAAQQDKRIRRATNLAYRQAMRDKDYAGALRIATQAKQGGVAFGGIQAAGSGAFPSMAQGAREIGTRDKLMGMIDSAEARINAPKPGVAYPGNQGGFAGGYSPIGVGQGGARTLLGQGGVLKKNFSAPTKKNTITQ